MTRRDINYIIKRVIIGVLISIILMLIGGLKVNAQNMTVTLTSNDYQTIAISQQSGGGNVGLDYPFTPFTTTFSGTIIGNFTYTSATFLPYQMYIRTANSSEIQVCNIGNLQSYVDSGTQYNFVTFLCPVNANTTYRGFTIRGLSIASGTGAITYGKYATITDSSAGAGGGSSSSDYTSILNNISNNVNNIATVMLEWRWLIPNINSNLNNIATSIQNQATAIQQNTQELQNINESITSEDSPSTEVVGGNSNEWSSNNANNGVINQLVSLPITLINSVVNGLSNSCSPYNLGSLFGTDLILPCVNMSNILGSLWTLIDVIISGIFIFLFSCKCVRIFDDFTNLKGGQVDTLYGGGN